MSFHHADPGGGEYWPDTALWRNALPLSLSADDRVSVVVAHPDDETLIAGGLIASAVALGAEVEIVCASFGEASHPESPTTTPRELASIRRGELATAAARLSNGQAHLTLLELPDGDLAAHGSELQAAIADQLAWLTNAPGTGLLITTWRGDGHPDHAAIAMAATAALGACPWATRVRHIEGPIWLWHWATETEATELLGDNTRVLSLALDANAAEAKRAAMLEHGSQIAPLSPAAGDETLLGEHVLRHFAHGVEVFVETAELPRTARTAEVFDALHTAAPDPWHVRSRWYELRKRAVTLASLPRPRFARVLEVGCSIGELSRALTDRAQQVLAIDASEAALTEARRLSADDGISPDLLRFERAEVPGEWPEGAFDCIVLSEVGYFLDAEALAETARRARSSLAEGGVIISVNWRHEIEGWPLNGADVDVILARETQLPIAVEHLERDFALRVFGKVAALDEDLPAPETSA